jgi:hypothetical protein
VLKIWGIEATQATQYFKSTHPLCTAPNGTKIPCSDNSVPFVAGKQVVLRLYVSGGTQGSWLAAVVTRPGSSTPFNPGSQVLGFGGIAASATPATRTNAASTIQVLIAPQQAGTWKFDVIVLEYDAGWTVIGSAVSSITLKFEDRRRIRVRLVRIRYAGRGMNVAAPSVKDFWDATDFAQRVLPVPAPGFEIVRESEEPYDGDFTRIDPSAHDQMWSGYAANRGTTGNLLNILDTLAGAESLPGDVIYVGIYPDNVRQSAFAGWAVGRWIISDRNAETFAHEILHKCGSRHAPCGGPADVDPGYPDYPSFSPLPAASIGEAGFDPSGMRAVDPMTTYDLMAYCGPKWISPYNYVQCFHRVPPLPPPPPSPPSKLSPWADRLVRFGFVRFPDRWTIVDLPRFARPVWLSPGEPTGELQVAVRDRSGRTLGRVSALKFPPEVSDSELGEFYEAEAPYHPEAAWIELLRGDQMLVRVAAEPAPELDVTFPSDIAELERGGGQLHYRASARGERLFVAVRATCDDGATWTGEVHSKREGMVDLVRLLAPFAGDDCWIEVLASSGYHTTVASSESFSIRPREREMLAWTSTGGRAMRRGDVVELVAIAAGGAGDPFDLRWTSDLCGEIGVGSRLFTNALSPGHHRIEVRSGSPFMRPAYVEVDVE